MYLVIFDESSVSQQEHFMDESGKIEDSESYESWRDGLLWVFRFNAKLGVFEEWYHPSHEHLNHIDPSQWEVDERGRLWIPCGLYVPSNDHGHCSKTEMQNKIVRFLRKKEETQKFISASAQDDFPSNL
jgi:hypothetical protein